MAVATRKVTYLAPEGPAEKLTDLQCALLALRGLKIEAPTAEARKYFADIIKAALASHPDA